MNKNFISALIVTLSIVSSSAFSTVLIQPTPKPSTGTGSGTGSGSGSGTTGTLSAVDDAITVLPGKISSVSGNVTSNDAGYAKVSLQSSPVSSYGYLLFDSAGAYTYTVYDNAPAILALKIGQTVKDQFTYTIQSGIKTATAKLTVTIIANPVDGNGNVIFEKEIDNVEIEFNDKSVLATPLNSSQRIKGHLYSSNDRDWYSIASTGDEITHIGVCETGSVCYGKKSWVMYVFDADKLTPEMENAKYPLITYRTDNGAQVGDTRYSKDMYLLYDAGIFEGALIGIVDPCFDKTNSVDIGAKGPKNYYVAISVPLKRDGAGCNDGSVILKKDGIPTTDGSKSVPTLDQYTSAFPNSDDEYAITVTNTGNKPLALNTPKPASAAASYIASHASISSFNDSQHQLTVPKVRIFNNLYTASLSYKGSLVKKSADPSQVVTLSLKKITGLAEALSGDPYQATYNPENDQVVLSSLVDSKTGETYSAVFKYHPPQGKKPLWLEAVSVTLVQ